MPFPEVSALTSSLYILPEIKSSVLGIFKKQGLSSPGPEAPWVRSTKCLLPTSRTLKLQDAASQDGAARSLCLEGPFRASLFPDRETEARPGQTVPRLEPELSTLSAAPGLAGCVCMCPSKQTHFRNEITPVNTSDVKAEPLLLSGWGCGRGNPGFERLVPSP